MLSLLSPHAVRVWFSWLEQRLYNSLPPQSRVARLGGGIWPNLAILPPEHLTLDVREKKTNIGLKANILIHASPQIISDVTTSPAVEGENPDYSWVYFQCLEHVDCSLSAEKCYEVHTTVSPLRWKAPERQLQGPCRRAATDLPNPCVYGNTNALQCTKRWSMKRGSVTGVNE